MKYYEIKVKSYYPEFNRIASEANGDKIPNAEMVFENMKYGNFQNIPPLFDYFSLESYENMEYWEWLLCDVYKFTRWAGYVQGWLISEKLKLLLDSVNMPILYQHYPSKLLYNGEKSDYYIFHFAGNIITENAMNNIVYDKSVFYEPDKNLNIYVSSKDEFVKETKRILKEAGYDFDKSINIKKIILKNRFDFFSMQSFLKDNIVSETLKNAIEENNIVGFEFSELDYEVVVEN